MKHPRILLAAACVVLVSCGDSSGPNARASGTVMFNFSGAGGGTYNVTGAIPLNSQNLFTTSWSVGAREDSENALSVVSVRAQSNNTFDEVLITIPRLTPGSVNIESCTSNFCGDLSFILGSNQAGTQYQFFCMLETGVLTIATINSTRATGSFSGTGTCFDGSNNESNFTVSGGSFDVALVSDAGF